MPAPRNSTRAAFLAAAVTIALVGGLVQPGTADASHGFGRSALRIFVTRAHRVIAPATTRPGIVQLSTGPTPVLLLEARRAGATRADVARRLSAEGPRPLVARYRIILLTAPQSDDVVRLGRGTYFLVDVAAARITARHIARMQVRGSRIDPARIPSSRPAVVTTHRHLVLPGTQRASNWMHVENHSASVAEVFLLRIPPRVSDATVGRLVAHPTFGRLFTLGVTDFRLVTLLGGHRGSYVHIRTYAGRYAAAAFVFTGNSLHLHRGQVRLVRVR